MSIRYYKLEGQTPVAVESFLEWNFWMALATFAETTVMYNDFNDSLVSTKFVGIDLNPGSSNADAQPMIFETSVMGGVLDGKKQIYPTWDEAIQGHLKICSQILALS
ncbi:MAG: hypothetical protein V7K76_26015 [Nostoc sp.]|uniref:hypothetical protein n=1 Tax=Nostoc sp. TaxID=1180 RepID=UPI002FF544F2